MTVASLLASIGLDEYRSNFEDNAIDEKLLKTLNSDDLREIGVAALSHRKRILAAISERYGGHVAQYLGDGVLAYFGFPLSHEDDAERSVRASLDLMAGLSDVQSRIGENLGVTIEARVGIETGPVIVGASTDEDNAAVGETPNLVARLAGGCLSQGDRDRRADQVSAGQEHATEVAGHV